MNRHLSTALALLVVAPLYAQQPPAAANDPGKQVVATINGEVVTKAKLDQLYSRLGAQMRLQYEKNGGEVAFLDNYIKKRLVLQEAIKTGFDKRPDIQAEIEAAKESAIFDRYVRDVVASHIVTDAAVKQYYEEHKAQFVTPERVHARHIIVTEKDKSKEQAMAKIQQAAAELHLYRAPEGTDPEKVKGALAVRFADAARRYSEDASAENGGDLGWAEKGLFDPAFEDVAFSLKPGVVSGVIQTKFGYHLVFVEEHEQPGTETLEHAKPAIREFLMNQNAAQVMEEVARLTNELRANSRVTMNEEALK